MNISQILFRLSFIVTILNTSNIYAATCTETQSASGKDNTPVSALINSFPCVTGVITGMTLDGDITAANCGTWFTFEVYINGNAIAILNNQCSIAGLDLSTYVPVSSITSVELRSFDNDNYALGDDVTLNLTLNITFTNAPMVFSSCTTSQNNTSYVKECETNAEVIGIQITTTGGVTPFNLTEFQFNMTGTTTSTEVSNISIYYTGNSNTFAATNLFANNGVAAGTITVNGSQTLMNGTNYFWIAYDMDPSATIGNFIDAECTQVTIAGAATAIQTPTQTAPSGQRKIGVCYPAAGGGASGSLKLWVSADQLTSTTVDNATITTWTDISAGNSYTGYSSPSYQDDAANLFNYNPTVDFDHVTNDYFSGPSVLGTSTATESAVYVVHKTNTAGNGGGLFGEKAGINRFMVHYPYTNGTAYWHNINAGDLWSTYGGVAVGNIEISTFELSQSTDTKTINVNGAKVSNGGDQTFEALTGENEPFQIGAAHQLNTTSPFFFADALIAEMIVYVGGSNGAIDRNKVESYLAIKYGITLDNTSGGIQGDYNSTNNTLIWDASNNSNYHNNVIGIGRDDVENLNQRQSHSLDDIIRLYINTLQTLNSTNPGSFTSDNSYIVMGDNQGAMCATATSNSEIPVGCSINSRIEREWKVTKTNFSQVFKTDFTLNTCAITASVDISHLRLLVDDDGDFSNGGTQCYFNGDAAGTVITYNNPVITVSNISNTHIANNSTKFITIASINSSTLLPIKLLNFDVNCNNRTSLITWSTVSENNNDYFTLEKSNDMQNFEEIAILKGKGNSSTLNEYNWTDSNPIYETTYYRLKQTDFNGDIIHYSPVSVTCLSDKPKFNLYPNPSSGKFVFNYSINQHAVLTTYNTLGEQTGSYELNSENNSLYIDNTELESGIYFYQVRIKNEVKHTGKYSIVK